MLRSRGLGRLGLLAVGLGIGAAVASTPGVASADSSTDPFSLIDELLGGLSVPAQAVSAQALDMQVSIGGADLFPVAGNTAIAQANPGDIAIAIGDNAYADAGGTAGAGDFAFSDGNNNIAEADGGSFDTAVAFGGSDDYANAEDGNFLTALINGSGDQALAGDSLGGDQFDFAEVTGNMLSAFANDGSFLVSIVP